jgi:outer membrane protein TolC
MTGGQRVHRRVRASTAIQAGVLVLVATAGVSAQTETTIKLSPDAAVALALEQNLSLRSVRYSPQAADEAVRAAGAAWTPSLTGTFVNNHSQVPAASVFDSTFATLSQRELASELAVVQKLPFGTSYSVGWRGSRLATNSITSRYTPELGAGATATVVQPLLRGLTFDAARADHAIRLRDRDLAQSEVDAAVADTKRAVMFAYWQWVYARDLLGVEQGAQRLAQVLLDGNRTRVAAGAMAAVDVVEAEAEVARRGEAIIVAAKTVANAEDLVRLLIAHPASPEYRAPLEPDVPAPVMTPAHPDATARALSDRQDLKDLRTAAAIDALSERQYRNETLPDATVRVGYSLQGTGGTELLRENGFGGPVIGMLQRNYGSVLGDVARLRYPTWSVQLAVGYPLGTAAAEGNAARARVQQRQKEASVAALEQRVITEVRAAEREVDANEKRLASTATAVTLAERRLDAEERKFTVGLSTSFFVFQAQRDLSTAREARLRAMLDHRLSLADLDAVQVIPIGPTR